MKGNFRDAASPSLLVPAAVLLVGAIGVGYLLTAATVIQSLALALLVLLFAAAFIWPEVAIYVVIFAMLLSPEFMAGELPGKAALGRGVTLRLEDFLLVFIGLSWLARGAIDKETGLFRKTSLNQPIFAYITVCVLATLWGKLTGTVATKAGFFFVLKYFEYMVVYFLIVNYVNTEVQAKRLLFCLFLTCFIVSIYGLIQIPSGVRVSAPFEGEEGEPNTFGGYLVFMGALAAGVLDHAKDVRVRVGLTALLAVLIVNLLYTQSRSSYLAVIPVCLALSLLSRRRLYLLAGLIIALIVSPLVLPRAAKERISYTITQEHESGQIEVAGLRLDTSTSARILSWQEGLSQWRKRPIVGHGITGYLFMDAQYPRILVETGVLGTLAFLWLISGLFLVGLEGWRSPQDDLVRGLGAGFIAGLIGLLVHAIGANTFILVRVMEPFWCAAGILIALSEMGDQRLSAPSA